MSVLMNFGFTKPEPELMKSGRRLTDNPVTELERLIMARPING